MAKTIEDLLREMLGRQAFELARLNAVLLQQGEAHAKEKANLVNELAAMRLAMDGLSKKKKA